MIPEEINTSAFARSIGMNESLLRKYKSKLVTPSEKQLKRIETGLHELGKSMMAVNIYPNKMINEINHEKQKVQSSNP